MKKNVLNYTVKKQIALLILIILSGCVQENEMAEKKEQFLSGIFPLATIDDNKVHLKWETMLNELILRPYELVVPEKIEICISENETSKFQKLIELDLDNGGSYSYTADRLQNGKPYFFYTISKKKGFESVYSDTLMVIPNHKKEFEVLIKDEKHTFYDVSIAHQKNKIAYVDHYYTWDGGENCCMTTAIMISNMDGSGKEMLTLNSYKPSWSPLNNKIAFHFDGIQGVGWIPAQIVLYDFETQTTKPLSDENEYNFAPAFSENGEFLLFQSSKNAPDQDTTNMLLLPTTIWFYNLKTFESFQVTDLSKTLLRSAERPYWIDNDRFLFQGTYPNGQYQIFESSVSKKQITSVFKSKWNDYTPSISPDKKKIAFVSDRSGTSQIWVYHIDHKTYSQITGYSLEESVQPTWNNIQWLDNSTIVFTLSDYSLVKKKVE